MSDVQGELHVISKMSAWRKDFGALSRLFGRTGCNYVALDPFKFTIDIVGSEIWEAGVKVTPELFKMQHKSFPYYDDWDVMFGFSKGTGDHAADFNAAKQHVNSQSTPTPTTPLDPNTGLEDLTSEAGDETSANPNSEGADPWKTSSIKKRKIRTLVLDEELVSKISSSLDKTEMAITELSSAIRALKEVDPQVTKVFVALQELPEFTMTTRICAAKRIVEFQTQVALFFSLDDEGRTEFVRSILAE